MDTKLEDLGRALDQEIKRLITFVDERIVPAARQDAHKLLRRAARELERLAEKLEKDKSGKTE